MRNPRSTRWLIAGRRTPRWLSWGGGQTTPCGNSPVGFLTRRSDPYLARYLAVLAGRKVPVVDRLLHELLAVILPELADRRIAVDHGFLQLTSRLPDTAEV